MSDVLRTAGPPQGADAFSEGSAAHEAAAVGAILLSAKNLTKRFGGLAAVNDVSLDLQRKQIHAVIGPNGAGIHTDQPAVRRPAAFIGHGAAGSTGHHRMEP